MTGMPAAGDGEEAEPFGPRRAHVESEVRAPETVAAAIAPDDTDQIDTRVEDGVVVTDIERSTTGGLEATIDDYVVALDVATAVVAHAAPEEGRAATDGGRTGDTEADGGGGACDVHDSDDAHDSDRDSDDEAAHTGDEQHADRHTNHTP